MMEDVAVTAFTLHDAQFFSSRTTASEMTCIVSSGALNSILTHSPHAQ